MYRERAKVRRGGKEEVIVRTSLIQVRVTAKGRHGQDLGPEELSSRSPGIIPPVDPKVSGPSSGPSGWWTLLWTLRLVDPPLDPKVSGPSCGP